MDIYFLIVDLHAACKTYNVECILLNNKSGNLSQLCLLVTDQVGLFFRWRPLIRISIKLSVVNLAMCTNSILDRLLINTLD